MTLKAIVNQYPGYVSMTFQGPGKALELVMHYVPTVIRCQQAQVNNCLWDLTQAELPFSLPECRMLGQSAEIFGQTNIRLAVVALPHQNAPITISEIAAHQTETQMQVFTEGSAALAWLMAADVWGLSHPSLAFSPLGR